MKFVFNLPVCKKGLEILRSSDVHDIYIANETNPEKFFNELVDADAFIIIRIPLKKFNAEMIERCKKLKVIGRLGVGYDMIDVKKAALLGIPVVITPGTNSRSVAEHAVTMMLALSKNLLSADFGTRNGNWNIRDAGENFEIAGKTVGLIGTGNIGGEVAKICEALGMKTIKFNSHSTRQELEYLLKNSDFVSLHAPINNKTRNMISWNEFSMMKPSAMLINTARSELVEHEALIKALNEKIIAGAGIDVFYQEPPEKDEPLLKFSNVILSPHSASITKEAAERTAEMCIKGCLAILNGEKWPYIVKNY